VRFTHPDSDILPQDIWRNDTVALAARIL